MVEALGIILFAIHSYYIITVGFKIFLMARSRSSVTQGKLDPIDPDLPKYTILIPLYKDAKMVPHLVRNMSALIYPKDKMQVIFVLEADDLATIQAASGLAEPFQVVVVPDSKPKTKPKACNYALQYATGDLLTIYDAEDRPEPDQLLKAAWAFRNGAQNLACVQAALNYFNERETVVTRLFTIEYSFWFSCLIRGLANSGLPFPLGGTSNHFRMSALKAVGGWDAYNVTEDADLGIRLSAMGYKTGFLNSTTWEEAVTHVRPWIKQRTRWTKGYMYTYLQHTKDGRLLRQTGFWGGFTLQTFILGTPLVNLLNPWLYLITACWLLGFEWTEGLFHDITWYMAMACLLIGNYSMIWASAYSSPRVKVWWALLLPAYWLLQSVATYIALVELYTKPHYWAKTEHGVSKHL
jgi:cellulose synthase/poly-beta-1,6-N-acetylglucosamine synthase-like glycosyltransferase